MQFTIDLNPTHEARLLAAAEAEGLEPSALAWKVLTDHLPTVPPRSIQNGMSVRAENQAAIDLLQAWIDEAQTATSEEIEQADEEFEELKRNLNANRAATGDRKDRWRGKTRCVEISFSIPPIDYTRDAASGGALGAVAAYRDANR